jgi:tricarballylate dehydrogenase
VDEGEDTKLYTYAKFGAEILKQPGGKAYQIFDQKTVQHLEPRYKTGQPIVADTIDELVEGMDIDDKAQALKTIKEYNLCAQSANNFDPTCKDGLSTVDLSLPKSNWATKIDEPPYEAYPTTGGITFTFGGLKINSDAQVIGTDWRPIPGLFTCGEMVGGLFHYNYPGGAGLVSGQVFGRIAGKSAANEI